MSIVSKGVASVGELLAMPVEIPGYQRPYKWQADHVLQLIDDVMRHRTRSRYRLGTVVLHAHGSAIDHAGPALDVVDGQQRLITLTLLCHALDTTRQCKLSLLSREFSSPVTMQNVRHNAAVIEGRLKHINDADRRELLSFLLHRCELIRITLDDLSEAFQFFDSQNARGKELEPHDLLKAFHLREMPSESDKQRCIEPWEAAASADGKQAPLRTIIGDVLFRIRRWSDGQSGIRFTRRHIGVFKGVSLHAHTYRFTDSLRALDCMVDHYNDDPVRRWDRHDMRFPFLLDQTIINGKRFFEYVEHYADLYRQLLVAPHPAISTLLGLTRGYTGQGRVGDGYVRNLFHCVLLYYYDKFGDVELDRAATMCFVWSYGIRLQQAKVVIESIDNHARSRTGLFHAIRRALHPHDLLAFQIEPVKRSNVMKVKGMDELAASFETLGFLIND
ncbi:DUF262 domain-containing protein [Burkholderia multivorans]